MPDAPDTAVIIPHFNDSVRLKRCLDALAGQDYAGRFEVIVVDNGSEQPPQELVESYPFARFARESKPGSYAARNHGLTLTSAPRLAFTDSDCIPQPRWLRAGVQRLDARPEGVVVGGAIEVFPVDEDRPTSVELYDMAFGLRQDAYVELGYAATANLFVSRETLDGVGPFNDGLLSSGDWEWTRRAVEAGELLEYAADAVVRHPARRSLKQVLRKARRHAGGRVSVHTQQGNRRTFGRRLRTVYGALAPDVGNLSRCVRLLGERGYGPLKRLRAAGVALLVQYAKVLEYARVKLGRRAERR